jgi:hypothetical protein
MPGEHIILSSTDGLARDLIDALRKESARPVQSIKGVHSAVQLDGGQLASVLAANRENLVLQNMVNQGNSRQEAEAAIDALLKIIGHVDSAAIRVGEKDNQLQATLRVRLRFPEGASQ